MLNDLVITGLILETFRLNGRLLTAGDALVSDLGLTSALWQVLGAVAMSPMPLPVSHIARNMGLTRQTVQRTANELEADGFVRFAPNPHHQRAKLVLLTDLGLPDGRGRPRAPQPERRAAGEARGATPRARRRSKSCAQR